MIQSKQVQAAIESFPKTFGLRAFPGKVFRIAEDYCYESGDSGIQLVTEVQHEDKWLHFSRSSVEQLRQEVVKI